jgi:hypothetical protein
MPRESAASILRGLLCASPRRHLFSRNRPELVRKPVKLLENYRLLAYSKPEAAARAGEPPHLLSDFSKTYKGRRGGHSGMSHAPHPRAATSRNGLANGPHFCDLRWYGGARGRL